MKLMRTKRRACCWWVSLNGDEISLCLDFMERLSVCYTACRVFILFREREGRNRVIFRSVDLKVLGSGMVRE